MKRLLIVMTVLVMVFGVGVMASAAIINFDDAATGTNINIRYTALGVTFSSVSSASGNAYAVDLLGLDPNGNGISLFSTDPTFAGEEGAVKAQFSSLQSSVSIDAKLVEALEYLGSLVCIMTVL